MSLETKQCLLCGSARSTKFRFHYPILSRENELCRFYHEVENFDALTANILPKQRAIVSRRINTLHSSILSLPPEILYEIFEAACFASRLDHERGWHGGNDHFQVVLASVSSYWRDIVVSSPLFWTQLSLKFEQGTGRQFWNRLALLRLYLTHSGSSLLNLIFSFSSTPKKLAWPDSDTLIHHTIDEVIVTNIHRIRELLLQNASPKWIVHTPKMTQLVSFSYTSSAEPHNQPPVISFSNPQRLRKLAISNWLAIRVRYASWTGLSTLTLESMEVNVCVTLLFECAHLVEFRCKTPKTLVASSWVLCQPWKSRVTRHHLEVFEWDVSQSERLGLVEMSMLLYIDLPALRSLRLDATRHSQHSALRMFCEHLPLTMTKLHLAMTCSEASRQDNCLFKFIPRQALVDDLTLFCTGCFVFLAHAFSWMEDPTFFPKLKRLTIDDTVHEMESRVGGRVVLRPDYGYMVYHMISPRVPSLSGFYMKFSWITVDWPEEVKNHFWMMVDNLRFHLTIQEDRMPFNSLPHMYTD